MIWNKTFFYTTFQLHLLFSFTQKRFKGNSGSPCIILSLVVLLETLHLTRIPILKIVFL